MHNPSASRSRFVSHALFCVFAVAFAAPAVAADATPCPVPVADAKPGQDAHVRAIEQGLGPMVISNHTRLQSIEDRMRYYGVPGISVAVIHDGKLAWAQGWGVRDASTCAPVTTSTQFQAASISKTIAAAAALRLVQRGGLSLEPVINSELKQWQLPLPQGAGPVTLRGLLSHTGGTTVHGFAGYSQQGPLPTTLQILEGAAPANSAAVRVDLPPGWQFRYSGGGYTVAELAMTDSAGVAYPALVQDEVFAPLDMQRSSVGTPLAGTGADVAQAHSNGQVIQGGYHRYPELAAAALWTTPSDLARLLIDVQAAAHDRPARLLKPDTARQMLTQQAAAPPLAEGWGLGVALNGAGAERRFGHDGRNEGFESTMVAYVDRGEGIVVLTNADRGKQLADEVVRAAANAYGWDGLRSREVAEVDVPEEALEQYVGYYRFDQLQLWIERQGRQLSARIVGADTQPLIALSPSRFISATNASVGEFERDAQGNVSGLRLIEGGPPVTLVRSAPPRS